MCAHGVTYKIFLTFALPVHYDSYTVLYILHISVCYLIAEALSTIWMNRGCHSCKLTNHASPWPQQLLLHVWDEDSYSYLTDGNYLTRK